MLGGYRATDPGDRQQGRASCTRRLIQALQTGPNDSPVLTVQGDHVGDGAEGDRVQRLRGVQPSGKRALLQRDQQLVGDAAGRQPVEGIGAIRLLRVDERIDWWSLFPNLVVIGNDQAHAGRAAPGDVNGVGPAIAGDHEARAARVQLFERLSVQAVAFGEPVGNVGDDVGANRPQPACERHARGNAVGVVVAVDRDPLTPMDGIGNQLARDRHVLQ